MAVILTLVPEEAAVSIARRVRDIAVHVAYVREVVARYDGLKAFHAELEKLGIAGAVERICADAPPAAKPE